MIAFLRSALFLLLAILLTAPVAFSIAISFFVPLSWRFKLVSLWAHAFMGVCKYTIGIDYQVIGRENIPNEAAVILSKHQSAWETIGLQAIFPPMVFVMKKSLLWIPFMGWAFFALKMITIDRTTTKKALLEVMRKGKERLNAGYWVVIFPEGTRISPGEKGQYKPGGAQLAVTSKVMAVPVAHNAGEFWAKNAFIKKPGLITVSIGPAIDTTGKKANEVNAIAEEWIEAEMQRISPHCYTNDDERADTK